MTAVLGRVRDAFVRPVGGGVVAQPAERVAERALPTAVAILCAPALADGVGAVTALAAARRAKAPCAVVCVWRGDPDGGERNGAAAGASGGGLAASGARRLTRRLADRGVAARARGRLVVVELSADPGSARAEAERVAVCADASPVVVVVAGPRPAAFDPLLATQARVLVVPGGDEPSGLTDLAVTEAARIGRATGLLRLGTGVGCRLAAATGWLTSSAARAAALAALDGREA